MNNDIKELEEQIVITNRQKEIIKVVNMKNYKFGALGNIWYRGFGMLDTETNSFVSFTGFEPCVYAKKKLVQSFVDSGWPLGQKRIAYTRMEV